MTETPREEVVDEDEASKAPEGPPETVDAASQEFEYPSDETDEG